MSDPTKSLEEKFDELIYIKPPKKNTKINRRALEELEII